MNIELVMTAGEAPHAVTCDKNAVIIDVLRASSVMVTAIHNKADKIAAFKTIEETTAYKENNPDESILLCGERKRLKIPGFDLGNSPLEYSENIVKGKTIAITTTNGTQAVENSKHAANMYVLSFLNLTAVCNKLIDDNMDTVFVCAGTAGKFSLDDFICAAKSIDYLVSSRSIVLDDGALLARDYYKSGNGNIADMMDKSSSLHQVIDTGFSEDVAFCTQMDIYNVIPKFLNGYIVKNI